MFLTIFTAIHDQAKLLPQMYSNLLVQFCTDFEWIIIIPADDRESLNIVNQWITANEMRINLFVQKEPGKHLSYNHALKHAKGELFFCLEPEDFITGEFVEELKNFWQQTYHATEYRLYTHESIEKAPAVSEPIQNPEPVSVEASAEKPIRKKKHFSLFSKGTKMGKSIIHIESEPFSFYTISRHFQKFHERYRERSYQKKFNVMPTGKVTFMEQTEPDFSNLADFTVFRSQKAQKAQEEADFALQQAESKKQEPAGEIPPAPCEPEISQPEPDPKEHSVPEKITMAEINAAWSAANIKITASRPAFEVAEKWNEKILFKKSSQQDITKDREICGIIASARSTKGVCIGGNLNAEHSVTFYGSTIRRAKPWQFKRRLSRHFVTPYRLPVVRAVVYRTEILKQYSFPVIPGERFIRDEVLYYQPDSTYALLPYPHDILVRPVLSDTLEGLPILQKMIANPVGSQIFFGKRIDLSRGILSRGANIIQYLGFRLLRRSKHYAYNGPFRHELIFYLIPGFFYGIYLYRQRRRNI